MLLADANVLLDLALVDGLSLVIKLEPLEILDVVLQEVVIDPRLPDLPSQLKSLGVRVVTTQDHWLTDMELYRSKAMSIQDGLCLFYAKTTGATLLTGDKPLRQQCSQYQVSVHGHLWVVAELFSREFVSATKLCRWLDFWVEDGSRLPKLELETLQVKLGCRN
jgi:predicted nucleic acid-binding protein